MSEKEYDFWHQRSCLEYAENKIRANGYTREEGDQIAKDSFAQLLPDGLKSKDNYLFTVKSETEEILGYLWFAVRGAPNNRKAFIYDIVVEEEQRSKGIGRKTMVLLEDEVKKLGLKHIGLHVFAFNKAAIHLYQSLGYETTNINMEKVLS